MGIGLNEIRRFSNISATPTAFTLRGGFYAVTVRATWGGGSVTLQRLAADATTYVTVVAAFTANSFVTVSLPRGTYRLLVATSTAIYVDVTSLTCGGTHDSVVVDAPIDLTAPTLSSATGTETSDTEADLSVDTDEDSGTLYWVVTQSATSPSKAQVKAGQDHTGAAADDDGSQAVSGTGTQNITGGATGLTAETEYYAHFMHEDAATNQSDVETSAGFETEAEAAAGPALTSPSGTKYSHVEATGSVTTDGTDGTLYWVTTTSGTSPSKAQVKAGQDHTGAAASRAGSQAVSGSGAQAIVVLGLTPNTGYFNHFMHENAATDQSTVSTSSTFTTDTQPGALALTPLNVGVPTRHHSFASKRTDRHCGKSKTCRSGRMGRCKFANTFIFCNNRREHRSDSRPGNCRREQVFRSRRVVGNIRCGHCGHCQQRRLCIQRQSG